MMDKTNATPMTRLFGDLESKIRHYFRPRQPEPYGLEIHASHACNLHCESCSHFSNHPIGGNVPLREAEAWMHAWSGRLRPREFNILGGEPTLNAELCGFVQAARRFWPGVPINLTTNGFFLHDHPGLPKALARSAPATLRVSMHHVGAEYQSRYREIEALVQAWEREWGIRVERVPAAQTWTRRYHGYGESLQPYREGCARKSFQNCAIQNGCHQLLDFKLFKCAPLAYLPRVAQRYALSEAWAPYLAYEPLDPHCSDADLHRWLSRQEIPECTMCPTRYEVIAPAAQPSPL